MESKFSNHYKHSLKEAAELAAEFNHVAIEPIHIFYGLLAQKGSIGAELFASLEIKTDDIKNFIAKNYQAENQTANKVALKFSPATKDLIQKSAQIAFNNRHHYIGTEHLLAALLAVKNQAVENFFIITKIAEEKLTQQIIGVLKSTSKLPELTETFKTADDRPLAFFELGNERPKQKSSATILDLFGRNLTDEKFQNNTDPVIGREAEIERIIQILSRRTKNNPLILGDPGVGKTALVEGLAKKIMLGDVPEILQHKKIYTLDLTATVAGTMFRGEFESRIKQIIDEVKRRPDIILFIDEIHNIVGAGSASGSMDAANILKPALARGEIRCIGATTFEDYRKTIENDPALTRRFQAVKISEPLAEEALKILTGVKKYYEEFHQVKITGRAIETAVALSQRYLPEKFLPDKAIDLLDEAAAAVKIGAKTPLSQKKIKELEKTKSGLEKEKFIAVQNEEFETAVKIKKEIDKINAEIEILREKQNRRTAKALGEVTEKEIAKIITRVTGIPAEDLIASEKKNILELDKKMAEKIVGQNEALKIISDSIKRAKAGLAPAGRPLASFIFVGPSGVGKTYAAKILAQNIFQDEKSLIKIDMSEYSEKFNVSKLIGAPAGYVGYKESGQLTEKIKHRPYAVVLFDEIEKANPEIFDLLLQVLEDGYLTDAAGAKINFQNTIIIMTSNLGSQYFNAEEMIGFGEAGRPNELPADSATQKINKEIKNLFKTEFLNRLDKIVYFNPLTPADLKKIIILELEKLNRRLSDKKINLEFTPELIDWLAEKSDAPKQGARAVKKIIQEFVETKLSDAILADAIAPDAIVRLSIKNGIIEME